MEHRELGSGLDDVTARAGEHQDNPLKQNGFNDISFCASPSDTTGHHKRRKGGSAIKRESIGGMLRQALVNHQLGITLNLLFLLALTYACFPDLRTHVKPFFKLQYSLSTGSYFQGSQDIWVVAGFIVLFTGARAACLDYVLIPFAKKCGIRKRKTQLRFAEQAYLLMYYIVVWTWGLKLFIEDTPSLNAGTTSGWINDLLKSIWRDFPKLTMSGSMKAYYLSQMAFWMQQILVIHLEERRKDHWQMLAHHFITVGLIVFSYAFRQMRAGNAILILMDVVDLVFPLAKCLRYAGLQTACDIAFGVFVITWFLARHVAYCSIVYSLMVHTGTEVMVFGTYSTADATMLSQDTRGSILGNLLQTLIDPEAKTIQWNSAIRDVFLAMLGGLQVITCIWFVMICRVVARVLRGEGADDSRSDDEGEAEDEEVHTAIPAPHDSERKFIEVTAEADDLYYPAQRSTPARITVSRKKSKGISSGLNLGEHKDILNRIGCLSDEQLAREAERRHESTSPQPGISKRAFNMEH